MRRGPYQLEVLTSIHDAPAPAWDALVDRDNPFLDHAFLSCLEDAGCLTEETGWLPRYLVAWVGHDDGSRTLAGAVPLYLKLNSYGEFPTDHPWLTEAHAAGVEWYPKLAAATPFAPAPGARLLLHPDAPAVGVASLLAGGALALADRLGASSVHWLACTGDEADLLQSLYHTPRLGYQCTWRNPGFVDFDGYLGSLADGGDRRVLEEREALRAQGLETRVVAGADLAGRDWEALRRLHVRASRDRGMVPVAPGALFGLLSERFAHRVVAVMVQSRGRVVAGSLAFRKGDHLYGRFWGAGRAEPRLSFELCHSLLIDYCIQEGLGRYHLPGAGPSVAWRGFAPEYTHSAHWIRDQGLGRAVERHISGERERVVRAARAMSG